MIRKLIIDVDTGVDDAQAIMLALSCTEVEVVAITCVSGNVHVDQVCTNTIKVLAACGRLDIPVYRGADKSLIGGGMEATHYHGVDGLSDAGIEMDVSGTKVQKEHAVPAIIKLVNQYPEEITLVALAPLTNIALAIRQDPGLGRKLAGVTIMGGNTQARGRVSLCAEFNFFTDPEAAYAVLDSGLEVVLLPYELETGLTWDWFDEWIKTDSEKARFMKAIVQLPVHRQRVVGKMPFYRSCDLSAMATVIDPEVIAETQEVYATVELAGNYTRGMMVVDWNGRLGKSTNLTLVKEFNPGKARPHFERMLLDV
ncbi:inosine-uridine preferring nucleoside hydrolase-like isoform X2 [Mya arenaria]|uniref:inosine-uridine preferring nucleoside hydrolase-like isoform X2 n=1 Tax=Mya arenaria TaxID=6604 RepID=UPI0022E3F18A|nr:inosine-uridine preferring nucleoside hydrolase-like isoform X2 [Mya arenaria]